VSALTQFYKARYRRYKELLNWRLYLPSLLEAVRKILPEAEVYVFGSVLRGELTANSDIDVLIVSKSSLGRQRFKIATAIEEQLEAPTIFEFHFASKEEVDWYRRHAGKLVPIKELVDIQSNSGYLSFQ
jgi:hypothetical protein